LLADFVFCNKWSLLSCLAFKCNGRVGFVPPTLNTGNLFSYSLNFLSSRWSTFFLLVFGAYCLNPKPGEISLNNPLDDGLSTNILLNLPASEDLNWRPNYRDPYGFLSWPQFGLRNESFVDVGINGWDSALFELICLFWRWMEDWC
jgi:hypothetical protein